MSTTSRRAPTEPVRGAMNTTTRVPCLTTVAAPSAAPAAPAGAGTAAVAQAAAAASTMPNDRTCLKSSRLITLRQ
jgi:hypothetical protein